MEPRKKLPNHSSKAADTLGVPFKALRLLDGTPHTTNRRLATAGQAMMTAQPERKLPTTTSNSGNATPNVARGKKSHIVTGATSEATRAAFVLGEDSLSLFAGAGVKLSVPIVPAKTATR